MVIDHLSSAPFLSTVEDYHVALLQRAEPRVDADLLAATTTTVAR